MDECPVFSLFLISIHLVLWICIQVVLQLQHPLLPYVGRFGGTFISFVPDPLQKLLSRSHNTLSRSSTPWGAYIYAFTLC